MTQKVGFEQEIKTFNRGLILASAVVVGSMRLSFIGVSSFF